MIAKKEGSERLIAFGDIKKLIAFCVQSKDWLFKETFKV